MVSAWATPGAMTLRPPGSDDLAAARPAGHEVRLHQAGGDLEIGSDQAAVEAHHRAAPRGPAEQHVVLVRPRVVVGHRHRLEDPRIADQLGQLGALVRAMEPRRDQHRDACARHARVEQGADQRSEEEAVRDRPRDVADEDAGGALTAGGLAQRRPADGLGQGALDRGPRLGQRRHRISGPRKRPFGTGRVMSQMRMQAERLPRAASRSAGPPTGSARARSTAARGSASAGITRFSITVGTQPGGGETGRVERPYRRSIVTRGLRAIIAHPLGRP